MRRTVLVVEDQALMAALLSDSITAAGFEVRSVHDVPSAVIALEDFDPDAAVIDIDLGAGPTGIDLGTVLYRTRPDIALLFLTDKPELVTLELQGSDLPPNAGLLLKQRVSDARTLVAALEAVLADRPDLARHTVDPASDLGLTAHQLGLLRDIAIGLTNRSMAERHHVSDSTIERWVTDVFKQLHICVGPEHNPRVEAARIYISTFGMPVAR